MASAEFGSLTGTTNRRYPFPVIQPAAIRTQIAPSSKGKSMKPYAYLGGHRGLLEINGFKLLIDTRDTGMIWILAHDAITYEPEVAGVISSSLQENSLFIDVGANIGFHTLVAARTLKGQGKILSFEPNPLVFNVLRQNTIINPTYGICESVNAAAYDVTTEMDFSFKVDDHRCGAIVLENAINYGENKIKTKVVQLDEYKSHAKNRSAILIKIDVEGREFGVLNGAKHLLTENNNVSIIMEYHRSAIASTNINIPAQFAWMNSLGLKPFILTDKGPTETTYEELEKRDAHLNILLSRKTD